MRKTYSEQLKDPRWQKMRLRVFEREKFTCEFCGSTEKTLHAHHTRYKPGAAPWEYEDHEILCICEECHGKEHERIERFKGMWSAVLGDLTSGEMDQLLGYAQGLREMSEGTSEMIRVISAEHLVGLSDAYSGQDSHYLIFGDEWEVNPYGLNSTRDARRFTRASSDALKAIERVEYGGTFDILPLAKEILNEAWAKIAQLEDEMSREAYRKEFPNGPPAEAENE